MMPEAIRAGIESMPPVISARPMLMLTGFLGAGKTTLLRSLLGELTKRDLLADVILNDIENALIDQATVQDHAAAVAALTGSCVCCEGMDLLYEMVLKASKSKHHVLLVELNGTADPVPLHETFTLLQSSFLLQPRWQACVIDARHFGQRKRFRELERLQLETASHYYLAHASEPAARDLDQLEQEIEGINPRASRTSAADLAASLGKAVQQSRRHVFARRTTPEPDLIPQISFRSSGKPPLHERHHLAHEFTGCNIVFPEAVEPSRVDSWLKELPSAVIRTKALVTLSTDPGRRFLYERVGLEPTAHPLPVRSIEAVPCSGIFIGPDLQPNEILQITRQALHPDCHFPEQ